MKKILSLFVVMVMLLCGAVAFAEPTAVELWSTAQTKPVNNGTIAGAIDAKIDVAVEGMNLSIPATVTFNSDVADKSGKGTMSIKADIFGQALDMNFDFYVVIDDEGKAICYMIDGEEVGSAEMDMSSMFATTESEDVPAVSIFTEDTPVAFADGIYSVKSTIADMIAATGIDLDAEMANMPAVEGTSPEMMNQILDFVKTAEIEFKFDEEYRLVGLAMNDATLDVDVEQDGQAMNMKAIINFTMDVSNIGGIVAADVEVPAEIVEKAVPADMSEMTAGMIG